jgi:hypothetical protein
MTMRLPTNPLRSAVANVANVASTASTARAGLDLGGRIQNLFGKLDLPKVPVHGLSNGGFKKLIDQAAQKLLGVDGPAGEQRVEGGPALARLNAPFPTDVLGQASKDWKSGVPVRSPEERKRLDADMANAIREVQQTFATKENRPLERGQHAKSILNVTNARLQVRGDLPAELQFGPFKAGGDLRTIVRFSNAPSSVAGDDDTARRGIALRFTDDQGHAQDLLLTTGTPGFLAKDGVAAVAAARAEAQGAKGLANLAKELGPADTAKLLLAAKSTGSKDESIAASTFFSRVPYQLGDYAVKFRLVPLAKDDGIKGPHGDDQLTTDAQQRLKIGDITYVLEAQFNKKPSDMADARIDWDSPYVALGKVVIPQQDPSPEAAKKTAEDVEKLSFKPWNRWDENDDRALKPLGDVNDARKAVYKASSEARGSGGINNMRCPMGHG